MILGILAGAGSFPLLAAQRAKKQGATVVTVGVDGITLPELETVSDRFLSISFGQLSKMIHFFKKESVQGVILAGSIDHSKALSITEKLKLAADPRVIQILLTLPQRNATQMLGSLISEIEKEGIRVLPSFCYLEEERVNSGPLTIRSPNSEEMKDMKIGLKIAKELAGLDIGLTVCLRDGAVLAVEALEGTDACIARAGDILKARNKNNVSFSVVKVARPHQDPRYDLPVVGPKTIHALVSAGASSLAMESGWTLLLDKDQVIQMANQKKIALFGLTTEQV